jgi:uncharacterized protein (TIGR02145 family)
MRILILLVLILTIPTSILKGQNLKTVKIGKTVWMAENINRAVKGSHFYNEDPALGAEYGRLYTWEMAQNACPTGWRLPSIDDWNELIENAGGEDIAGKTLGASGSLRFNAKYGGFICTSNFMLIDSFGGYWSSTSYNDDHAWYIFITTKNDLVTQTYFTKTYGFSVRCVQDE